MSRNLSRIDCYFCNARPSLVESARPITREDAGVYFDEYAGMLVAMAECPCCLARYLAWIDMRDCRNRSFRGAYDYAVDEAFFDLSFRSSFDDEPGDDDMPVYWVQTIHVRTHRVRHDRGEAVDPEAEATRKVWELVRAEPPIHIMRTRRGKVLRDDE